MLAEIPLLTYPFVFAIQFLRAQDKVGKADHLIDVVGLLAGQLARAIVHPGQVLEVVLEGVADRIYHLLGAPLRLSMEDSAHEQRAQCKAHHLISVRDAVAP